MRAWRFQFFLLPFLFLSISPPALADTVLFSRALEPRLGYCCAAFPTAAQLFFGIYDSPTATLHPSVFDGRLFTTADIGATFTADAESDGDFTRLRADLTNGANDLVGSAVLGPEGFGTVDAARESLFFRGLEPVRFGPDLLGYDLTSITLTIQDLQFLPFDVPEAGGGTIQAHITYAFVGNPPAIPEPATMTLLGIGLAGLAARRRRSTW